MMNMVVLPPPPEVTNNLAQISRCRPAAPNFGFSGIPVVDLSNPDAKSKVVAACREFGFFKIVSHGVAADFLSVLESKAVDFFNLPQELKEKWAPPGPLGYGCKNIGPNGDVGWIEYLLFHTNTGGLGSSDSSGFTGAQLTLRDFLNEYVAVVRSMTCTILEMVAEELGMETRDTLSRMVRNEDSDSCFRVNHYPSCPDHFQGLIGFGEHTDPHIMSVLRSNDTSGFQILLNDGSWVDVPPDPTTFFFIVMTNGRLKSVKHRVVAAGLGSRLSMIFFGGPPESEKIAPLRSVMEDGEESLYKEFTWAEYMASAYKTRLGDNRLSHFEKKKYATEA
ncbi:Gibberellin 2-beta-dioxygenase 2 [Striga hermonthica]|uniref:gibberellin 2beta-dioxygenase n=1 Tax=Striga hermonthica TaxID=68872 RepID=A0A9N7NI91_STRHE|nr:Gibberellin 2-beta-dioxygenase 2 [Striga hermonthica]